MPCFSFFFFFYLGFYDLHLRGRQQEHTHTQQKKKKEARLSVVVQLCVALCKRRSLSCPFFVVVIFFTESLMVSCWCKQRGFWLSESCALLGVSIHTHTQERKKRNRKGFKKKRKAARLSPGHRVCAVFDDLKLLFFSGLLLFFKAEKGDFNTEVQLTAYKPLLFFQYAHIYAHIAKLCTF